MVEVGGLAVVEVGLAVVEIDGDGANDGGGRRWWCEQRWSSAVVVCEAVKVGTIMVIGFLGLVNELVKLKAFLILN